MGLLISLRAEILKIKRTASFYLAIVAAGFGPLMSMLDMLFDEGISAEKGKVIFNTMLTQKFQMTGFAIFPIFLILICTLLPQLEYKNNAWKQVLTSPQTRTNVFVAKFITIQLFVVFFLVVYELMMLAGAVILHFARPSLHVLHQPLDGYKIGMTLLNSYVSLLALCSIQFWLGLRCKNFIVPIAVGIGLWFTGSFIAMQLEPGFGAYFPYSFHVYGAFEKLKPQLANIRIRSGLYTAVFLIVGFMDFKRRAIK